MIAPRPGCSPVWLVDLPDARGALVFGMRWSALVGSDVARLASRRALGARATHYVQGGQHVACVGHVQLARGASPAVLYSAAQAYASAHPRGCHALALALPDGRAWVVGARDGAVLTRTDRVYASTDGAIAAIETLREQLPGLQASEAGICPLDVAMASWLGKPCKPAGLVRVRSGWRGLPRTVRAALCVLAVTAAFASWRVWHPAPVLHKSDATMLAERARLAERGWRASQRAAIQGVVSDPGAQIDTLFARLGDLPASVHGWLLHRARCELQVQTWACRALYGRTRRSATNDDFSTHIDSRWRPAFQPLEQASLAFTIPLGTVLGDIGALPGPAGIDTQLASHLQSISSAFSTMAMGAPQTLQLLAPRLAGAELMRPPDLPVLRRRRLDIAGPMRSFIVLRPTTPLEWDSLEIRFNEGQRSALTSSPLSAALTGWVYEKQ